MKYRGGAGLWKKKFRLSFFSSVEYYYKILGIDLRLIGPIIKIWRQKQKSKYIGIFDQKIKNMEGWTKGNLKNNFSKYAFL